MQFKITTVVNIDIDAVVDELLSTEDLMAEQAVAYVLCNTDVDDVVEDYVITEEQWAPIFDAICAETWKRIMERR